MERKTAIATAAAITMSVVSGLFALGASSGIVGASSTPSPAVQTVGATPAVSPTSQAAGTTSPSSHETHEQESPRRRDPSTR